jgi:transcriptional regulator with XRE-family HTH domain
MSRPSTGTTNVYRLRKALGLYQYEFSDVLHVSPSLLRKLEYGTRTLTPDNAENIAARTGISPGWLLRNDPREPLIDSDGRSYDGKERFKRAQLQFKPVNLALAHTPPILVRTVLLQRYAEARDLFSRPEMYQHLIKFALDLQLLCARYEMKADYPESMTGENFINAERDREKPDKLFSSIIRDAERCYKAVKLQRERVARAEAKEAKRLAPFLPREERARYGAGTRLFTKRGKRRPK